MPGQVHLGPLLLQARNPVRAGKVKVALRPEAWRVWPTGASPHGDGLPNHLPDSLPGRLLKQAYLGSFQELTVETELGEIFIVSPDLSPRWTAGDALVVQLSVSRASVVAAN